MDEILIDNNTSEDSSNWLATAVDITVMALAAYGAFRLATKGVTVVATHIARKQIEKEAAKIASQQID